MPGAHAATAVRRKFKADLVSCEGSHFGEARRSTAFTSVVLYEIYNLFRLEL
jgi:hypothetical protein